MKIAETLEVLKFIEDCTMQTGTLAYGLPAQDHDRFCTPEIFQQLVKILNERGIHIGDGGTSGGTSRSVKFTIGADCFNVFAVPSSQMLTVQAVTEMVSVAAKYFRHEAMHKHLRVHLFRTLRDTFTMWTASAQSNSAVQAPINSVNTEGQS